MVIRFQVRGPGNARSNAAHQHFGDEFLAGGLKRLKEHKSVIGDITSTGGFGSMVVEGVHLSKQACRDLAKLPIERLFELRLCGLEAKPEALQVLPPVLIILFMASIRFYFF